MRYSAALSCRSGSVGTQQQHSGSHRGAIGCLRSGKLLPLTIPLTLEWVPLKWSVPQPSYRSSHSHPRAQASKEQTEPWRGESKSSPATVCRFQSCGGTYPLWGLVYFGSRLGADRILWGRGGGGLRVRMAISVSLFGDIGSWSGLTSSGSCSGSGSGSAMGSGLMGSSSSSSSSSVSEMGSCNSQSFVRGRLGGDRREKGGAGRGGKPPGTRAQRLCTGGRQNRCCRSRADPAHAAASYW
jgi:hypothetical protein